MEHGFYNDKQRVVVRQVFAGEDLEAGQEIDLCSDHWLLSADEEGGIEGMVNESNVAVSEVEPTENLKGNVIYSTTANLTHDNSTWKLQVEYGNEEDRNSRLFCNLFVLSCV